MDLERRKFLILSGAAAPAALAAGEAGATSQPLAASQESLSVLRTGAVGDGRADDTAAIQAAMDAHHSVYIPAGRYRITRSLRFRDNQELVGASKGGLAGRTKILIDGPTAAFRAADQGRSETAHPVFRNLTIEHASGPSGTVAAGSMGIDLDDTSYAVIEKCAFRYHERCVSISGRVAGYYNSLLDNEYASSTNAIFLGGGGGGNSNRIIGGRIFSCRTGIHAESCNENFLSLAIENCELGLHLGPGTEGFYVYSRFEGCGDPVTGGLVFPSTRGAAVLIARGGFNHHIGGTFANAGDRIIDLDGRNFIEAAKVGYSATHQQSISNLFWNEALLVDSNGDGIADGLSLAAPLGPGSGWQFSSGPGQRISVPANASKRDIRIDPLPTTAGQPYVLAVRCRTNVPNAWNLRGSAQGYGGTDLGNFPLSLAGQWAILSFPFLAPASVAHFYFALLGAGASQLEIDAIWFGPGSIAPPFGIGASRQPLPTFASNAAAVQAGLPRGSQYSTPTGEVRVAV